MPINKPRQPVSLLSLLLLVGLAASIWIHLNPPDEEPTQVIVTCMLGNEPFYSGPVDGPPTIDGNLITLDIAGSDATLSFLNSTCAILSSPN
jgi:hypothetical protein